MIDNPVTLILAVLAAFVVFLLVRANGRAQNRPKTGPSEARPYIAPRMPRPLPASPAEYRADLAALDRVRKATTPARFKGADGRRRADDLRRQDDPVLMTDPRHPLFHTLMAPVDAGPACGDDRGGKNLAPACTPPSASRSDWDSPSGVSSSRAADHTPSPSYDPSPSYGGSDSSSSSSSGDSGGGGGGD
jgi:hypothetical protein